MKIFINQHKQVITINKITMGKLEKKNKKRKKSFKNSEVVYFINNCPHNYILMDNYWQKCTCCGNIKPALDM